jgi:hypothetical protein
MSNKISGHQPESYPLLGQENHLLALARSGHLNIPGNWLEKRPFLVDKVLYPLAALLFGFMAPFISAFLGLPLLLLVIFGPVAEESAAGQLVFLVGSFLPLFFLIWLWLWLFERRPLWTVGLERPFLKKYLRGLGVGLLMVAVAIAVLALFNLVVTETPIAGRLSLVSIGGALLIFFGLDGPRSSRRSFSAWFLASSDWVSLGFPGWCNCLFAFLCLITLIKPQCEHD